MHTEYPVSRVVIRQIIKEDQNILIQSKHLTKDAADKMIMDSLNDSNRYGYYLFSVFEEGGLFSGYCGCRTTLLNGESLPELIWNIDRKNDQDEIDVDVAFFVRNFFFKHTQIQRMIAYVHKDDVYGRFLVHEIDMTPIDEQNPTKTNYDLYEVTRTHEKFKASFGDGENTKRTSVQRRRDHLNPASSMLRPRLKPY